MTKSMQISLKPGERLFINGAVCAWIERSLSNC